MHIKNLVRTAPWLALAAVSFATAARADETAPVRRAPIARTSFIQQQPAASPDTVNYCVNGAGNLVDCTTLDAVSYYGHRIISNPVVWVVFWTNGVDATTQASIGSFYNAVTNSVLFDWLIEYSTIFAGSNGTDQALGRGVYGGAYTITPTSNTTTSIADGDIEQELKNQFNNGGLPQPDNNSIYMVYFPPGYTINGGGSTGNSCTAFCAYHSAFDFGGTLDIGGQDVFYGVFPDLGSGGCNGGCGGNTTFENLCSVSTHELVEAATDGEVGFINIDPGDYFVDYAWDSHAPLLGSSDNAGNEVGDMCNGSEGTQFTDQITGLDDGAQYTIQKIYSQNTSQCQTAYELVDDYRFYIDPTVLVIAPGTTRLLPVTSETTAGSPGVQAISIASGSLAGITASLDKTTLNPPSDSTNLRVTAADSATINSEAVYTLSSSSSDSAQQAWGAPRTAAVMVWVEPAPASIALNGISNGEIVQHTVSLSGTASPYSGRTLFYLALYIDGERVAYVENGTNLVSYSWNTSALTEGTQHTVILYAEDSDGGNSQIDDTVTIGGPPVVAVTAPANNATVNGAVSLTATATAGIGTTIAHLSIAVGNTVLGSGTTSPYTASWNTATLANGSYSITATVTDVDGTTATSAPISVTVHNPPTIAFTTPATGTVSGMVAISAAAAPVHGETISGISLSIDGAPATTSATSPLTFTWDATGVMNGTTHTLSATVTDVGGATATATKMVTVRDGPLVNVTHPTNGTTVSGAVTVSAAATPASGTAVTSIALSIDGTQLATMSTSTITESWDTTQIANGPHTVSALATDADGGNTTSTVTVTVDNVAVPNGFAITIDPATQELPVGSSITYNIRTTATGTAETITLSYAGLPPGVIATLSGPTITAGDNATLTLSAPAGTAPSDSTLFSVGGISTSVPGGHSATASVTVESGASSGCSSFGGIELALLGLIPLLRRKRTGLAG